MNVNKDYQKLIEHLSVEEITEAYVLPQNLSEIEKQKADVELNRLRRDKLQSKTEKDLLFSKLMALRYQIQDSLSDDWVRQPPTAAFLKAYIYVVGKKQKELAEDLSVHPTRISRILNGKEKLNLALAYRLEYHSGKLIPAILWWKLAQKETEMEIKSDNFARKMERLKVKNIAFQH